MTSLTFVQLDVTDIFREKPVGIVQGFSGVHDFSKGNGWYLGVAESMSHALRRLQFENCTLIQDCSISNGILNQWHKLELSRVFAFISQ